MTFYQAFSWYLVTGVFVGTKQVILCILGWRLQWDWGTRHSRFNTGFSVSLGGAQVGLLGRAFSVTWRFHKIL